MIVRTDASSLRVAGLLLAAAAAAWALVAHRAGGMQAAPGTMGLGAAAFLGLWAVMMAAMMLPALVPVGVLYAGQGEGRGARASGLMAGYLLAWAAFGLIALGASVAAARVSLHHPMAADRIGAAVLVLAGVYQLSPLKHRCLALCRSPLQLLMRAGGFRGRARHVRAGIHHGAWCAGCCWALMAALLALGVMDLRWMAGLAGVITLEKVWRHGRVVTIATAIGLIALGLVALGHPGLVPGLHRAPMEGM